MVDWFTSLSSGLMLFWSVALIATAVLIAQILIILIGAGFDAALHTDIPGLTGHHGVFGYLSVQGITAFFGGFGWSGVIVMEMERSFLTAAVIGVIVGLVLMLSVALVMRLFYSLGDSGTLNYSNAIGSVGTVYLAVPSAESGPGQIQIMIQGRMKIIPAYTKCEERIVSQSKVKVIGQVDANSLYVEPLGAADETGETSEA